MQPYSRLFAYLLLSTAIGLTLIGPARAGNNSFLGQDVSRSGKHLRHSQPGKRTPAHPPPIITRLSPTSIGHNDGDFTQGTPKPDTISLTVYGRHFLRSSKICFNGVEVKTIFHSGSRLGAIIPLELALKVAPQAGASPTSGIAKITVINKRQDDTSSSINFTVKRFYFALGG